MEWEELVRELDEQQRRIKAIIEGVKRQQEAYSPGSEAEELLNHPSPRTILDHVDREGAHVNVPLAMFALTQMKFNQQVISLLTDLDHRKTEPGVGSSD